MLKVQFSCGKNKFDGWLNTDICGDVDKIVDITKPLPFEDNSVDFLFQEHGLEHIDKEQGK
jgi:predicted SAM-dependent methyltransferase